METSLHNTRFCSAIMLFLMVSLSQASTPMWTFTPNSSAPATQFTCPLGPATIQYTVTNQSPIKQTLIMKPIAGINQPPPCHLNPKGTAGSTCLLTLTTTVSSVPMSISGGPILCAANPDQSPNPNQCYQPSLADRLNITLSLCASVANGSTLALSVTGLTEDEVQGVIVSPSGIPRIITITNKGTKNANNVTYNAPGLPTGAFITSSSGMAGSCGTIAPGGTCVLTITPGANPSAQPGNLNPTPVTLSIAGTNTNTLTPGISILTYGSVYQSGYVYAFDDRPPNTVSVAGKVAALTDQAGTSGIIWSSNGTQGMVSYDVIPGIDDTSVGPLGVGAENDSPTFADFSSAFSSFYSSTTQILTPSQFNTCNGNSDGSCDSSNILTFYNTYTTNQDLSSPPTYPPPYSPSYAFPAVVSPTPPADYATGLCAQYTIDSAGNAPCNTGVCYSGWYLPAICELGVDTTSNSGSGCGTNRYPSVVIQNMQVNLAANGFGNFIYYNYTYYYWSSTEYSFNVEGNPTAYAWTQYFSTTSSAIVNGQTGWGKSVDRAVRCSRAF
ncbi:MAG: hypothetical protein ACHP65_05055 [Legionellales bacterium]